MSSMRKFIEIVEGNAAPLLEANVIGSAVRKDEIPSEYKHLPIIGRGSTSIALEETPETVLVFTRDAIKKDWIVHHGIGELINTFETRSHHVPGMRDFPIYVIRMPKLYPLSLENKRIVNKAIKEYRRVWSDILSGHYTKYRNMDHANELAVSALINHFTEQENNVLAPLWDFLINYDASQFTIDLGPRNFKQTADGELVILDPVVSKELLDILRKAQTDR